MSSWDDLPEALKEPLKVLAEAPIGCINDETVDMAVRTISDYMYDHHTCTAEVVPAIGPRYDHGGLPAEGCDKLAEPDEDYCDQHNGAIAPEDEG